MLCGAPRCYTTLSCLLNLVNHLMTQYSTPRQFYRYRSLAGTGLERVREMVLNAEHYFTSPAKFNDPFDCRPVNRFNGTDKEVRQYLDGLFAKFQPDQTPDQRLAEIDAILADPERDPRRPENLQLFGALFATVATDQTGMLCLSADPGVPLMWSHYADSHAGVCLGFDPQVSYFAIAQPVRYTRSRPIVDPTVQNKAQMLDATLFTKSLDWAYEEEWRIVLTSGSGKYMLENALRSIVVGAAISHEHFKEVLSWTKALARPVEIYRAFPSTCTFEVDLRRYRK